MKLAPDVLQKISVLNQKFANGLIEKVEIIASVWRDVRSEPRDESKRCDLHRMVHTLAGSGQTFGFPEISVIGLELEEVLERNLDASHAFGQSDARKISDLIEMLGTVASRIVAERRASIGNDDATAAFPD